MGRVFSLRIDDGEDILEELTRFAGEKGIACGMVQVLGALRPVFPPVPHVEKVAAGGGSPGACGCLPRREGGHRGARRDGGRTGVHLPVFGRG
ncbi:PCC domain-containing protein [Methanofollis aquaemaris]|uniref:PCC domain-containing protein n=1 Tax=Methanofollis aquaemaris TaxID=126734 RepID=UPI003742F864